MPPTCVLITYITPCFEKRDIYYTAEGQQRAANKLRGPKRDGITKEWYMNTVKGSRH
jgi:hypothetical protein